MADNKKKKTDRTSLSSDDAEIQNLKAEMAHLEQLQTEWKISHTTESVAPPVPQTPAQRSRQERTAKRRARQQKAITDVNEFFEYQQEMLTILPKAARPPCKPKALND